MREAARFGEVNAYYYADRTIAYANALLTELGEPLLPPLRVIVNAHPGSHLPGYRSGDGEIMTVRSGHFPAGTIACHRSPGRRVGSCTRSRR